MSDRTLKSLVSVTAVLRGMLGKSEVVADLRDIILEANRAIGAEIRGNHMHDAGACARCSYCGRYAADARALSPHHRLECDCGRIGGWSGSFVAPSSDSLWSLGLGPELRVFVGG